MPQKVLKFTGINRKVNEFQNSGACEELINLRPEIGGGHSVVKQKHIVEDNVSYVSFYEHSFGDTYNSIVTLEDGSIVWTNTADGKPVTLTDKFANKKTELSSAGNVLVVYCEEDNKQAVFRFKDEKYEPYDLVPPHISYALMDYKYVVAPSYSAVVNGDTLDDYKMALNAAASGFYTQYKNSLCGVSVVGCTFEMEDGSEIWSTAFTVANPLQVADLTPSTKKIDGVQKVVVKGIDSVYFNITISNSHDYSGVRKINVYASRPVYPYEIVDTSTVIETTLLTKKISLDELKLGSQLMYYQGSLEISEGERRILLNFSTDMAGEKVMDVNAGCTERLGNSVSYNNRFHYYKSKTYHEIQMPTTSTTLQTRDGESLWVAYVNFDGKWKLVEGTHSFKEAESQDFIYPMSGVKKLAFVKATHPTETGFDVPYEEMFYVDLVDSSSYNYSYAFNVIPEIISAASFKAEMQEIGQMWYDGFVYDTKIKMKDEANTINVSAPYNPYVFPVEYSYGFSGEIKDITTSYLPISSTQVGQFPISVFTSAGIYALEQGDGSVLYSNITPLQPIVIDGKATATPYGTFFLSSKNMYVLSGREIANVSYVLSGKIDYNVRSNESFAKICCSGKSILYDFSDTLSNEDFESYVSNATLTYDQLHNEVHIVSNDSSIQYAYVLNLDSKSYHKVDRKYIKTQDGSKYAIEISNSSRNLVDMHVEDNANQPVLLLSRPLSLEAFNTHIQRLIMLVDAKLEGEDNISISVFGSDNLYDWKCIISSQKHNTAIRQIRTNKAAKSYKDYIILINGVVCTDTDISEIIADYTVVNRRLG